MLVYARHCPVAGGYLEHFYVRDSGVLEIEVDLPDSEENGVSFRSAPNAFVETSAPSPASRTDAFAETSAPSPASRTDAFVETSAPSPASRTDAFVETSAPSPASRTDAFVDLAEAIEVLGEYLGCTDAWSIPARCATPEGPPASEALRAALRAGTYPLPKRGSFRYSGLQFWLEAPSR